MVSEDSYTAFQMDNNYEFIVDAFLPFLIPSANVYTCIGIINECKHFVVQIYICRKL